MQIKRTKELQIVKDKFKNSPIVAILGPRQCGKTTLSRQFAQELPADSVHVFDLEDPNDLARLDQPKLTLEPLQGTIIIDEIQRRPELFPVLRVLVDRYPQTHYLILGSASRDLIAQGSETLAGRISFLELEGFNLQEVDPAELKKLWVRGGFPKSFLAPSYVASYEWRQDFISTFLERDIPNLGLRIPPLTLRRFWMMLTHYHGQALNFSDLGKSLGVSDTTVRRYLDILTGTFMIRSLPPWFQNTKKRYVKLPKIYFRDSGILHALMSLVSEADLLTHPRLGASWEGFALEQFISILGLRSEEVFFWAVHTGAELDLFFQRHGKSWGVEFKFQDAPKWTPSIKSALQELELEHLWVVYPGKTQYALHEKVTALPLTQVASVDSLGHWG